MTMAEVKAFVRSNNTATIICPACNAAKKISAEPYRSKNKGIKVRCRCGEVFTLRLDFRSHYRKLTDLPGTYAITTQGKTGGGVIHIRNISREGIGFTVTGMHHLEPGLELTLKFRLDDKQKTKLEKKAIVRLVEKNYIGCQFVKTAVEEKALGFYLQP